MTGDDCGWGCYGPDFPDTAYVECTVHVMHTAPAPVKLGDQVSYGGWCAQSISHTEECADRRRCDGSCVYSAPFTAQAVRDVARRMREEES